MYGMSAKDRLALFEKKGTNDTKKGSSGPKKIGKLSVGQKKEEEKPSEPEKKAKKDSSKKKDEKSEVNNVPKTIPDKDVKQVEAKKTESKNKDTKPEVKPKKFGKDKVVEEKKIDNKEEKRTTDNSKDIESEPKPIDTQTKTGSKFGKDKTVEEKKPETKNNKLASKFGPQISKDKKSEDTKGKEDKSAEIEKKAGSIDDKKTTSKLGPTVGKNKDTESKAEVKDKKTDSAKDDKSEKPISKFGSKFAKQKDTEDKKAESKEEKIEHSKDIKSDKPVSKFGPKVGKDKPEENKDTKSSNKQVEEKESKQSNLEEKQKPGQKDTTPKKRGFGALLAKEQEAEKNKSIEPSTEKKPDGKSEQKAADKPLAGKQPEIDKPQSKSKYHANCTEKVDETSNKDKLKSNLKTKQDTKLQDTVKAPVSDQPPSEKKVDTVPKKEVPEKDKPIDQVDAKLLSTPNKSNLAKEKLTSETDNKTKKTDDVKAKPQTDKKTVETKKPEVTEVDSKQKGAEKVVESKVLEKVAENKAIGETVAKVSGLKSEVTEKEKDISMAEEQKLEIETANLAEEMRSKEVSDGSKVKSHVKEPEPTVMEITDMKEEHIEMKQKNTKDVSSSKIDEVTFSQVDEPIVNISLAIKDEDLDLSAELEANIAVASTEELNLQAQSEGSTVIKKTEEQVEEEAQTKAVENLQETKKAQEEEALSTTVEALESSTVIEKTEVKQIVKEEEKPKTDESAEESKKIQEVTASPTKVEAPEPSRVIEKTEEKQIVKEDENPQAIEKVEETKKIPEESALPTKVEVSKEVKEDSIVADKAKVPLESTAKLDELEKKSENVEENKPNLPEPTKEIEHKETPPKPQEPTKKEVEPKQGLKEVKTDSITEAKHNEKTTVEVKESTAKTVSQNVADVKVVETAELNEEKATPPKKKAPELPKFKPIPEEFYDTLFYFSGMGTVVGSALCQGVYVPQRATKTALDVEVIENYEAVKDEERKQDTHNIRTARHQAGDLSEELRKLQGLLGGLPNFADTTTTVHGTGKKIGASAIQAPFHAFQPIGTPRRLVAPLDLGNTSALSGQPGLQLISQRAEIIAQSTPSAPTESERLKRLHEQKIAEDRLKRLQEQKLEEDRLKRLHEQKLAEDRLKRLQEQKLEEDRLKRLQEQKQEEDRLKRLQEQKLEEDRLKRLQEQKLEEDRLKSLHEQKLAEDRSKLIEQATPMAQAPPPPPPAPIITAPPPSLAHFSAAPPPPPIISAPHPPPFIPKPSTLPANIATGKENVPTNLSGLLTGMMNGPSTGPSQPLAPRENQPKYGGARPYGEYTNDPKMAEPSKPWQERYGSKSVENLSNPKPFNQGGDIPTGLKPWQLSRLRGLEAKGYQFSHENPQSGADYSDSFYHGYTSLENTDIKSYSPFLVSGRSQSADREKKVVQAHEPAHSDTFAHVYGSHGEALPYCDV